jgi:hypothetical protein
MDPVEVRAGMTCAPDFARRSCDDGVDQESGQPVGLARFRGLGLTPLGRKSAPRTEHRGGEPRKKEHRMARDDTWAGWIWFAGLLLLIIGTMDFFQGLIAVIRGDYYTVTPNQIIVFDLTAWGWITLIWGIIVGLVGLGLLSGQSWARWTAIIVGSLNFLIQLGFVGSSAYPLWALVAMALNIVILYALIVRWSGARSAAAEGAM